MLDADKSRAGKERILLTKEERRIYLQYLKKLQGSRTFPEARIYKRKMESILAVGRARNVINPDLTKS